MMLTGIKMIPSNNDDVFRYFVGDLKIPKLRHKILIVRHFLTSPFSWVLTGLRRLLPETEKKVPKLKPESGNNPRNGLPPQIPPSVGIKIDLGCGLWKKPGFIGIDNYYGEIAWGNGQGSPPTSTVTSPGAFLFSILPWTQFLPLIFWNM